jgi:hypothetical protein
MDEPTSSEEGVAKVRFAQHQPHAIHLRTTPSTKVVMPMRLLRCSTLVLAFTVTSAFAAPKTHEWSTGKVLDEGRARYFAGMYNNSSSSTSSSGSLNGSANSTTSGNTTSTNYGGDYSGSSNTSSSGFSTPIYKVYDNLVVEGTDYVYVTSERLRWRWSKGAHVAVNGEVKYYVDGRKLHLLDNDGKEHSVEILKQIRKPAASEGNTAPPSTASVVPASQVVAATPSSTNTVSVAVDSTPKGADIEIDENFVGNTPSTVQVTTGQHTITVKKKGFTDWSRKINVTGGSIHVDADLDPKP